MSITAMELGGHIDLPVLVVGPSLGTSVASLWSEAVLALSMNFRVIGWDLPGHGFNRSNSYPEISMTDLAQDLLGAVDEIVGGRDPVTFNYAGNCIGGAVGLQLLLDAPNRVSSAVLLCAGGGMDSAELCHESRDLARATGMAALREMSAQNWFAPGFLDREPARADSLLAGLADLDEGGYLSVCAALATFDVKDRLAEIATPVLAVAGSDDVVTPPVSVEEIARGVSHGSLVVLSGVAHLAPAESPAAVARLISEHALRSARDRQTFAETRKIGMAVRREVLGDSHVDRATANATKFTRDFQEFISEYAWGSIWARNGLDRRARSMVTLTALVARGHHEELAMHVRAARINGVSVEEIKELLLQTAIYCGVPDANAAFRIAQAVLLDLGDI